MTTDHDLYPYASGSLLVDRNTYFYTKYGGPAFLDAWRRQRSATLAILPDSGPAPSGNARSNIGRDSAVETVDLLEHLFANMKGDSRKVEVGEWLARLVKKFETTKRIHEAYDERFRAVDRGRFGDRGLYVRLAEVFEAAYATHGDLQYLNVLFKCIDTLCSFADRLDEGQGARLAALIGRELFHVENLCAEKGITT